DHQQAQRDHHLVPQRCWRSAPGLGLTRPSLGATKHATRTFSNRHGGRRAEMRKVLAYLNDQRGVETLEWIAVGALIVALALAVYPGTLATGINGTITSITNKLTGIIT